MTVQDSRFTETRIYGTTKSTVWEIKNFWEY